MNLKRQLLLVSLLTLMLPWAGCEFIRETESALRTGQQQMLAATARAIADSMAQYAEEFPLLDNAASSNQIYIHPLKSRPEIDGYIDDWSLQAESLRSMRGADGPVQFAVGSFGQTIYLYVHVSDRNVVYATSPSFVLDDGSVHADRVNLISSNPPYLRETIAFATEAPGKILSYRQTAFGIAPDPTITAHWQDTPDGYRLEARIPASVLGTHLGIVVNNTDDASQPGTRSSNFSGQTPGPTAGISPELDEIAERLLVQDGMRLLVTDVKGWRIAAVGALSDGTTSNVRVGPARRIYDLLVESGKEATFAEPDPLGREQQTYIGLALQGRETASWFRSEESGRAIVAVAAPIRSSGATIGAVVLQQGTEAILSLTNTGLARLINLTLIATLVVAGTLLGYATWLSRRIRHLSVAAEAALENESLQSALPSSLAGDEIGDLSRSFSSVLQQLGDYNQYLRSLASKLSHELRTPLAIVTSSLENLEHEPLNEASVGYTVRARDGADRLRRILTAMSEASRVEELMANVEPERFDLREVLEATTVAYRDVYKERSFTFNCDLADAHTSGSPELLIQMLDKLIDNAVDFSSAGDAITIGLATTRKGLEISVMNPGPPLPERMRTQMFDSMVSVRSGKNTRHLGLGLYVARLIAAGHGGRLDAENVDGGVVFKVSLPMSAGAS